MSRKDLLPDAGPVFDLRQALYRAGRDCKGVTSWRTTWSCPMRTCRRN